MQNVSLLGIELSIAGASLKFFVVGFTSEDDMGRCATKSTLFGTPSELSGQFLGFVGEEGRKFFELARFSLNWHGYDWNRNTAANTFVDLLKVSRRDVFKNET